MRHSMLILVWVFLFATGAAAGVEGADFETGLVAHWKFNETDGTTAHDSSGNGHDGVLNGGPQWSSGYLNGGLQFDGEDDEVEVPYSADLNPADAFTVTAWAKASSGEWNAVISSRADGPPAGFIISAESGRWNFGICGSSACNYVAGSTVGLQKWVHLAGVYSEGKQRFYVNGESVGESSHTLDVNEVQGLFIGAVNGPIPGGFGSYMFFSGILDEVRLYNRALSGNEVTRIVANDMFQASFKATTWEDEYGEEHAKISLVFPRNGWRYALEQCDTLCIWRRVNPTVVPAGGGLGWEWTMDKPPRTWSIRVAVESRTPAFGELDVLVNPITTEVPFAGNPDDAELWISNVSDDWAIQRGFRPLGSRLFWTSSRGNPQKGDHAMWMVRPSGDPYTGDRSPICEVEFVKHQYALFWHLEPLESGYVALGDYWGEEEPSGRYRPVAVREDLVFPVGPENLTKIIDVGNHDYNPYACKRVSEDPNPQEGKLFDPGRVFCGSCRTDHLYMLRLPPPQSVRPRRMADELITFGPLSQPGDFSAAFVSHIVTVPYTEVRDPRLNHNPEWQRQNSPFYALEREEAFQLIQKASGEGTFEYADTQGTSTEVTETYSESSSFTVNLDGGITVQALELSPGISMTKEMGWETAEAFSNMREKSVTYSATVLPYESAGIWFRCYRLIQRDARGEAVNLNPAWMVDPNEAVFTYYPPR